MEVHFEQRANYALEHRLNFQKLPFFPRLESSVVQAACSDVVKRRERRREPRLAHSFPARVWGVDIDHEAFGLDCVLDDISPSGLYLRIPWKIKFLSQISLVVQLVNGSKEAATAAIRGKVIRDQPETDGKRGIAVRITEYCFL